MPDVDRHWPTKEAVLAAISDPSTKEKDLSHALEVAGTFPTDEAAAVILPFMSHPSPFVREFALIGLSAHLARDDVRGAVERMSMHDPCGHLRVDALLALLSGN